MDTVSEFFTIVENKRILKINKKLYSIFPNRFSIGLNTRNDFPKKDKFKTRNVENSVTFGTDLSLPLAPRLGQTFDCLGTSVARPKPSTLCRTRVRRTCSLYVVL